MEDPFSPALSDVPCLRLRGGGGDGGTTGAENRTVFMEMYRSKKAGDLDPAEERRARYERCALSGAPLEDPIVLDALGTPYNKEAVLRALMEQLNGGPKLPAYISLKSLIPITLARADPADPAAGFRCPITDAPFSDKNKYFHAHRATGLVFSERAIRDHPALVDEAIRVARAEAEGGGAGPPAAGGDAEGHAGGQAGGKGLWDLKRDFIIINGDEKDRAELAEVSGRRGPREEGAGTVVGGGPASGTDPHPA